METKPGIYTTEFWVTALTVLGLVLASFLDAVPDKYAAIVVAVSTGAYTLARGLSKMGAEADPTVSGNFKLVPTQSDMIRRP
jgi:hypothetical protein